MVEIYWTKLLLRMNLARGRPGRAKVQLRILLREKPVTLAPS